MLPDSWTLMTDGCKKTFQQRVIKLARRAAQIIQETRRNNGGMASELGHKYVIVHIKGERTKMVRALSYASREEASVLKQKKKFPPRIETSKQVFSPTGVF